MNLSLALAAKGAFIGVDILRAMAGKTTILPGTTQGGFDKTQWTEILVAAGQQTTGATQAPESLCARYRPPLYAFIRAQGRQPADAEDLVQGFFLHLLAKDRLRQVNQSEAKSIRACLNCGQQNRTNRFVCAECTPGATESAVLVPPLDGPSRANGITRWLRRVMNFIPFRAEENTAPPLACHQTPAMTVSTGEMEHLRARFRQHQPKPARI